MAAPVTFNTGGLGWGVGRRRGDDGSRGKPCQASDFEQRRTVRNDVEQPKIFCGAARKASGTRCGQGLGVAVVAGDSLPGCPRRGLAGRACRGAGLARAASPHGPVLDQRHRGKREQPRQRRPCLRHERGGTRHASPAGMHAGTRLPLAHREQQRRTTATAPASRRLRRRPQPRTASRRSTASLPSCATAPIVRRSPPPATRASA
jgi:hypothetical protein